MHGNCRNGLGRTGNHISVDEVIKTMGQVGRAMPESLRETSQGGLAATYS